VPARRAHPKSKIRNPGGGLPGAQRRRRHQLLGNIALLLEPGARIRSLTMPALSQWAIKIIHTPVGFGMTHDNQALNVSE